MKAKIYRGAQEIGGTCIELTANNGKILWIDLGTPLDTKNLNIDYAKNKLDALLISHPHKDHVGLMEMVGKDVPIYIGELSLDLINATKIFLGEEQLDLNFKLIKPWKEFVIEKTFKVKAYLTDHSTPEAFAFLIEADGKNIFYSGDFRATGRKNVLFEKLLENPPKNIDLLFIEGTMVERENHRYASEESVEQGIYELIKNQNNVAFVISSAQNVDRLVSVYRACKRTNKYLVIDIYVAWILEMVRKQSESIPAIEWKEIKVFEDPNQLKKIINNKSFDEFRERISKQLIGNTVFSSPSNYVYFVRYPNEKLINKLRDKGTINIIYSQWVGYLKDEELYSTKIINKLKDENNISFQIIHTSGHATVPDLIKFAKAIDSMKLVPIHTAYPESFKIAFEKEGFENTVLWEDGKEYEV